MNLSTAVLLVSCVVAGLYTVARYDRHHDDAIAALARDAGQVDASKLQQRPQVELLYQPGSLFELWWPHQSSSRNR